MSKHIGLLEQAPSGAIINADPPLRVTAMIRWRVGTEAEPPRWIEGWAMAWTSKEVLVWWRDSGEKGMQVWLPAAAVKRR